MTDKIIKLRQLLHSNPELSNKEFDTSVKIEEFISSFSPNRIINIGKTGKAFVFEGKEEGKTVVFRAELDALPIQENSNLDYKSKKSNFMLSF